MEHDLEYNEIKIYFMNKNWIIMTGFDAFNVRACAFSNIESWNKWLKSENKHGIERKLRKNIIVITKYIEENM